MTGHANQARITTFPQSDPENCLFSSDVISFARCDRAAGLIRLSSAIAYHNHLCRSVGLYGEDQSDESFSFSDTYDPVTFSGARFCEARVWSFFSTVMVGRGYLTRRR